MMFSKRALVRSVTGRRTMLMHAPIAYIPFAPKPVRADEEHRTIQLKPRDMFFVSQTIRLMEIIDDYLEVAKINNIENELCDDRFFKTVLAAYDLSCKNIGDYDAREIFIKKYAFIGLECYRDADSIVA